MFDIFFYAYLYRRGRCCSSRSRRNSESSLAKLFARIPGRERAVLLASLSEHVRLYQASAFFRFGRRYS